jgi:maltose alpha-D-glucosyltransferase/alpha-amylase
VDDGLWFRDAIVYELHIRAFHDANSDGIGDLRGLIQKLDYLQDLGVTALWLLPFSPSPLRDDGYDTSDYTGVHPDYGTLGDFRRFLEEAHRRGLRVITELVLNHTSDQHSWFQRARRAAPGTRTRNFYVWSETSEPFKDARIIFNDFEPSNWTWDPVAGAYYWHRFYSHQPDLNYDSPDVQRAMQRVIDFWLRMGVDGLRLDAVPYLFEREGTTCENLPQTHAFLKAIRRHVDERFPGRMLLAEANQWPEDACAYFGQGDECHMAFHFPLMPRLFMALRSEDRLPIVDIQAQTPDIPANCQWALFLRNHDELTLEMVTEEERLYMFRSYARLSEARVNLGIRRRLAPLMNNDRRRIELMNALLFSMPGTPIVYYGDEIGMGDNIYLGDREGVRTPMQWSGDRNAGFSHADPQALYLPLIVDPEYHHAFIHVDAQQGNRSSLLWFMKRLIAVRKRHQALARGTLEFLHPSNHSILAFIRQYEDEQILVVANLSRFVQGVELDLRDHEGCVPVEITSQAPFWPITDQPYVLTLGPFAFYWFRLAARGTLTITSTAPVKDRDLPALTTARGSWEDMVRGKERAALGQVLAEYVARQPWFGGKSRRILAARVEDALTVPYGGQRGYLVGLRVDYADGGTPEIYLQPLAFTSEALEDGVSDEARIARVYDEHGEGKGLLYDALWAQGFPESLAAALDRRRLRGDASQTTVTRTAALRAVLGAGKSLPRPHIRNDRANSTALFEGRFALKLYRRLENGEHPEVELGTYLTRMGYQHSPKFGGALVYRRPRAEAVALASVHAWVAASEDGWQFTLRALDRAFAMAQADDAMADLPAPTADVLKLTWWEVPPALESLLGDYLKWVRHLGRRTAELHCTLAAAEGDPGLTPEPISRFYQRSLYQAMRNLTGTVLRTLRRQGPELPDRLHPHVQHVLEHQGALFARLQPLLAEHLYGQRIRCHGNYHLEQVLLTGDDVSIIDFEGEPARPLAERRLKRPPFADAAAMLRSFANAAYCAVRARGGDAEVKVPGELSQFAEACHRWMGATWLDAYLRGMEGTTLLPKEPEARRLLLETLLVERGVYELGHALNHRPDDVEMALAGLMELLADDSAASA